MLDTVVVNGTIADGTGAPTFVADVGIANGRVVEIGRSLGSAKRRIDADGQIVSPGFIDVHTHLDVQGFWDPALSPSPLHGITTVVGGNCGFSVAPLEDANAEFMMRMLARVEGMPLDTLQNAVPWTWTTTGEFLDALEGRLAVNAGFMVGHSALRRQVMGPAASERAATPDERDRMCRLLHEGLAAGGFGFSSSWSTSHFDGDGAPVPSRLSERDELIDLARVCGDHVGTSIEFVPRPGVGPFEAADIDVLVDMSLAAQRPLNWNLLSVTTDSFEASKAKLHAGTVAKARGAKVIGLVLARNPGSRYSFLSGVGLDGLPGWAAPMALPPEAKQRLLESPQQRARLRDLAAQPSPLSHHADWAGKFIVQVFEPNLRRYENRYVGEIAVSEGKDPLECLLDIVCADRLQTSFLNSPRADTSADWRARVELFRDSGAVIGASDAGAHLDMVATFDYPSVVLSHAVREHELMTVEEAVHLLSDVPARLYGLEGRGRLEVGAVADIVAFDPASVGTETAAMTFDLPGGSGRLFAHGSGYRHVLVNGEEIVSDGAITGACPGAILRSGADSATPSMD